MGVRSGNRYGSKAESTGLPPSPFASGLYGRLTLADKLKGVFGGAASDLGFGLKVAVVLFVLGAGWSFGIRYFGFKSDLAALKHIAAAAGCDAAALVGVAPAKEGEPGYWDHLDLDQDTVACEPNDPAVTGKI